jgi:uncharacterized protein RhaS with RHS repeats
MGARYYDPNTARFTQPDPSGQETNPYLYAAGDPINLTDPSGLAFWDAVKRVGKKSMATAAGGGVTGCIAALATGCVAGATIGGFAGAVGGAVQGTYEELQ